MPVFVKLLGKEQEFAKVNRELIEVANLSMRARALAALAELKRTTPVDTGRARNSWSVTKSSNYFRSTASTIGAVDATLLTPVDKQKLETLYITNGVGYIEKLNQGSSKQAPSRFIETAIFQFFDVEGLVFTTVAGDLA